MKPLRVVLISAHTPLENQFINVKIERWWWALTWIQDEKRFEGTRASDEGFLNADSYSCAPDFIAWVEHGCKSESLAEEPVTLPDYVVNRLHTEVLVQRAGLG